MQYTMLSLTLVNICSRMQTHPSYCVCCRQWRTLVGGGEYVGFKHPPMALITDFISCVRTYEK